MAKVNNIVAGIVGLGFDGYSGNCVKEITSRVSKDLQKSNLFDLIEIGEIQNYQQGQAAIESFSSKGCDLLIAVASSWLDARGAMPFFLANKELPILVYSTGGRTRKDGALFTPAAGAGAPGLLEPMRSSGLRFQYIYEEPDEATKVDAMMAFAKASRAKSLLKHTHIGSMGFADMGLYCTNFDNTAIRNTYGVATEFFDMLEVEKGAEQIQQEKVDEIVNHLQKDWKCVGKPVKNKSLERIARLTQSMRGIIKERKLSAFSLKCVEGMQSTMECAPCMIGSLLGDECWYVCECDIPGMLGHVILNHLSQKPATFVESYEFWKDRILFGVCGFLPSSMIEGEKLCKVFREDSWQGVMNCSKMKTGRMTLIRPFVREGKQMIHMLTGEAVPAREWVEIGYEKPGIHPSVELILDGTMQHYLDNVPAQHYSMVYADCADEVKHLCKLLDVELIYERTI